MSHFELTIEVTPVDTETINRQGKVVALARSFGGTGAEVIWAQFAPFETNVVEWGPQFGLYASPDPVKGDSPITASSTLPLAEPGLVYPFADGVFGTPVQSGTTETFSIRNESTGTLTFGLTQTVTANGSRLDSPPIDAISVPSNDSAELMPPTRVAVFLFRRVDDGVVVIVDHGQVLELDFEADPKQTIHYDGDGFAVGPLR